MTRLELPSLQRVDGFVGLSGADALADLDGLGALEEITGSLHIEHMPLLASTEGLASLREVGEEILVVENGGLTRVELPALERAAELRVMDEENLEAIDLPAIHELGKLLLHGLPTLTRFPDLADVAGLRDLSLHELPLLRSLSWAGTLEPTVDSVWVHDAPLLADLSPLAGMVHATTHVSIGNLPALASLQHLAALEAVDGALSLGELPGVTDVAGLASLHTAGSPDAPIPGGLFIRDCAGLSSLVGLQSLATIEDLAITGNAALGSLEGLYGLTAVSGAVTIAENPQLQSLDGLDNLQTIAAGLALTDNAALSDIDAIWPQPIGVLLTVGEPQLQIRGNGSLSQCVVDEFVSALISAGWLALADTGDNLPCR